MICNLELLIKTHRKMCYILFMTQHLQVQSYIVKMKLEQNLAGPELITSCKETQLTRLQCRVEQLATQPRRHSLKIINLCESHDEGGDDDYGAFDGMAWREGRRSQVVDRPLWVKSFIRCLKFDSKSNYKHFAKYSVPAKKCRVEYQIKDKSEFRPSSFLGPCWCQQIEFSGHNFALLSKIRIFERIPRWNIFVFPTA